MLSTNSNKYPANGFPSAKSIPAANICIISEIGSGAYGCVCRCKYTNSDGNQQEAAIKVYSKPHANTDDEHSISDPISSTETTINTLRKEYQLISSMSRWKNYPGMGITADYFVKSFGYVNRITWNHKPYLFGTMPWEIKYLFFKDITSLIWNIIACYAETTVQATEDTSTPEFIPSIVMEPMKQSLYDALNSQVNPLSISQKIQIAYEIACALYILHAQNIMHGDLKPLNILLDENNHAKLCDFGSSVRIDYACEEVLCTLCYAPPEVDHHRDLNKPTFAIDIYSFGIVLFAMFLKNETKKHFNNIEHKITASLNEKFCLTLKADSSIPPGIISLIENCTHPTPAKRPCIKDVILHIKSVQMAEQLKTKTHPHPAALWTNRTEISHAHPSKPHAVKISPN